MHSVIQTKVIPRPVSASFGSGRQPASAGGERDVSLGPIAYRLVVVRRRGEVDHAALATQHSLCMLLRPVVSVTLARSKSLESRSADIERGNKRTVTKRVTASWTKDSPSSF